MPVALNHAHKPIGGAATPAGTVQQLSWSELENALRRAGVVRPGESVVNFIVADTGIYMTTERL